MAAKLLKEPPAAQRPHAKRPRKPREAGDVWSGQQQGPYARSYDLLSDALMLIFERIYLPLSVMERNPRTGGLRYTAAGLDRFEQIKDRYIVTLRNNGADAPLELEISPAPLYKGLYNTGIADPYLHGPEEIRSTITGFFDELNEIAAGMPGVRVNPSEHLIVLNGPQPFYNLIAALCADKGIVTTESDHAAYARGTHQDTHECDDIPAITGRFIRNNIQSECEELSQNAQIPTPVLHVMATHAHSWREIGHLVSRFNDQAVLPLLSLKKLQAAVDHDLGRDQPAQSLRAYHLH